jgi:hypothetical protein
VAYYTYFGGIPQAIKAAGLEAMPTKTRPTKYTREELQEQLRSLSKKLGRRPTYKDVEGASRKECAGPQTIVSRFGTFRTALESIGFEVGFGKAFTREELIAQLQQATRELGRMPSTEDMKRTPGCAYPARFNRAFGSAAAARKAAGLHKMLGVSEEALEISLKIPRETLIEKLRSLAKRLGRPPTSWDLLKARNSGGMPSKRPYIREFGSLEAARKAAGIKQVLGKRGRRKRRAPSDS